MSSGFRMLTDEWHVCVPACNKSDSRLCFEGEQIQVRDWSTARDVVHLDRGLNGIVVPRGLFFNSEFFESLNTTTWSYSNPLLGSMVMGNDNPLELNARVVQMLIAANLTLLEDVAETQVPLTASIGLNMNLVAVALATNRIVENYVRLFGSG